ncbi:MAG: hypothetical protein RR177_05210 [Oscillospiraceae bacterium]
MMEIIINVIALILAIIGIVGVIRYFALLIFAPKQRGKCAVMVLLKDDSAEFEFRAAIERLRWDNIFYLSPLIAVDCGLDSEGKAICEKIAFENKNVIFCSKNELTEYLC